MQTTRVMDIKAMILDTMKVLFVNEWIGAKGMVF